MYDIVIRKNEVEQEILLIENGILIERIVQNNAQDNIEGNIYLGKVQNVLPGMQAAFVNIGENKNAFIHLKDILPKIDEKQEEHNDENIKINDVIRPGEAILVQVNRSESNRKGARVSTHISLSGKYTVLMPNATFVTVSQKIEDNEECTRLKEIIKEILPKNMGAIVRTSAKGKSKKELQEDVENLKIEWSKIAEKSKSTKKCPILISKGNSIIKRMLIDLIEKEIRAIVVNDEEIYRQAKQAVAETRNLPIILDLNLNKNEDLLKQIAEVDKRKIWLKCGGFITIDKTEALTAIDVNSGKYIGTKNLEQTVYTVNKEATIEIAKQLKLKDIGGIIIIDYIDMSDKKNREQIEKLLKEELKKDRSKTQVIGFTPLNLLEMTRKHIN